MAYITRNDPAYALAGSQNEQGAYNGFDQYLNQTPMTESYWRNLGYTGPMDEASIQQWMTGQGLSTGFDAENAQNALMGASGPLAGSTYSVDDTGDFMRDALITAGGGYFGGSALAGAMAPAAATGAAAAGGAAGGGGAITAAGAGLGGGTGAAGLVGGGALTAPGAFSAGGGLIGGGTAAGFGGASLLGSAGGGVGTSLMDFLTGGGNVSDYGRLLQAGIGLYSQNRASDAAQQGQSEANALMRQMYEQNRADNQPLLDMRNKTLPQIQNLLANPSSITSDPGYQFGLTQGQSQIDNNAAARGGYYSGAQLKASQRYGQDYAGTKLTDSLNRLMGVAGLGQVGATANQSNNTNYSQMGGNGLMQQGNIRGSGYVGMGNTVNNGIGDWINDYYTRKGPGG